LVSAETIFDITKMHAMEEAKSITYRRLA